MFDSEDFTITKFGHPDRMNSKVIVWENGQNGQSATSGFLQNLARSLPPMMQILKDVGGVELPEYIARFSDGKVPPTVAPPEAAPAK